jgi:small subunit ribosomal protein S20
MPNIKAAQKWMRQTEKRSAQNKEAKTRLKTLFKSAAAHQADAATVEAAYDKAAGKGIIHPNKAARKKSRLAKALKKTAGTAATKKAPKARATPARKTTSRKKKT